MAERARDATADLYFFFQAEDGIRDLTVTGVQTCALPISPGHRRGASGVRVDLAGPCRRARNHAHRDGADPDPGREPGVNRCRVKPGLAPAVNGCLVSPGLAPGVSDLQDSPRHRGTVLALPAAAP